MEAKTKQRMEKMTTDAKLRTQEGPKKLTFREMDELSRDDFERLSKEDRKRFFSEGLKEQPGGVSVAPPSDGSTKMEDNYESNGQAVKRPTHAAWWVKEREGKKGEWRQIGVAWGHSDGKGMTISLDLQPLDGRVVLRLIEDKRA